MLQSYPMKKVLALIFILCLSLYFIPPAIASNTPTEGDSNSADCYFPVAAGSFNYIKRNFGATRSNKLSCSKARCHSGVDIYTQGEGKIVSVASGTVTAIDRGHYTCSGGVVDAVVIQHDGYVFRYGELTPSSIQVQVGQSVEPGQYIGNATRCGMLHLSKYTNSTSRCGSWCISTLSQCDGSTGKPDCLLNPTADLERLLSGECAMAESGGSTGYNGSDTLDDVGGDENDPNDLYLSSLDNPFLSKYPFPELEQLNFQENEVAISDTCKKISDSTAQQRCLACAANNGFWTAIGCLPTEVEELAPKLIRIIMGIGGLLLTIQIIISGAQIIFSSRDSTVLNKARTRITNSIIALLFIIFGAIILQIIGVRIFDLPGFFQ